MAPNNPVVAHFMDGTILKGTTQDFAPTRAHFHIIPSGASRGQQVRLAQLKAVFFVRKLDGDPDRSDLRGFITAPPQGVHGRKIAVRFADAELLCGYAQSYSMSRDGFFIFPADAGSNNQRVFVITANAAEICEGDSAEALAQRILDSAAA